MKQIGLNIKERNMKPLYNILIEEYRGKEDECPTLIFAEDLNLPDVDIQYLKTDSEIITTGRVPLSKILQREANFINQSWRFNDAYYVYVSAIAIAEDLGLRFLPQIIPAKLGNVTGVRGQAVQNDKDKTFMIYLRDDMSLYDKSCTLAHELRHAWQHEYAAHLFDGYDINLMQTDLKSYYMQPAELDAEAYSFMFVNKFFESNETIYNRKCFAEVNAAVNARIQELEKNI